MYDRFLVPYYALWPIAFISFVFVFFIPTDSEIEITNKDYNISSIVPHNQKINFTPKDERKLNNNQLPDKCINFLKDPDKPDEISKVDIFDLIIKIIIFILFAISILNIICNFVMLYCDACYDSDTGGYCQNCTMICSYEKDKDYKTDSYTIVYIVWSFLFCICLLICILSGLSMNYSSKLKDKMKDYCDFKFDTDYKINKWKNAKYFLGCIIGLYSLEILLCIYSMCYFIIVNLRKK